MSGDAWTLMHFLVLLPMRGTGDAKYSLKHDTSEICKGMIKCYPLAAQNLHCISDNISTTDDLSNNVLEVFRIGLGGDEDLGFCAEKLINILIISFLPTKKSTSNRQLNTPRTRC